MKEFEKRCAFLCIALMVGCCLMVATVAATPDVTHVNLDISPAVVPGDNNYLVCFHINSGLSTSNGIFITFDESTMVDEELEEDCITISYNGTSAHPEIREIINNPDPEYEQYHFPDGTTTVKMSVPFNIPFNNDLCVNFTCGIYNDCPCGPHNVWVNTDLEKVPVISNPVDMNVTITADVIAGNGNINSPKGAIAPPEFIDLWSCGDSPCYSIVPAPGGNITDVWVDGESVLDELTWYPNGSAQYCFTPLTCSYELTAKFEVPPTRISGYKLDGLGEPLFDWEINLYGETGLVDSYTTGSDGYYEFLDIPFGIYTVNETSQSCWILTDPEEGFYEVEINEDTPIVDNLNFTNRQLGVISGYKLKYPENTTLTGWEINLYDETGLVDTYTTESDGYYEFLCVPWGMYIVNETLKDEWFAVAPADGSYNIEITETSHIFNLNFTNEPGIGNISGYKLNYTYDKPLSGWTINLYDEMGLIRTYVTGPDGYYQFLYLPIGSYEIDETPQPGWNLTDPQEGYYEVEISKTNSTYTNLNFTNQQECGSISGYKLDIGGNGISGWEMTLSNEIAVFAETETDDEGFYIFSCIPFDTYTVTEELKEGYFNITPLSQGNLIIDEENMDITDVNFINNPTNISGYKLDYATGLGIPGWEIALFNESSEIAETITDDSGFYVFSGVPFGTYTVEEELETGWMNVTPLSVGSLTLNETNPIIGDVNFTNERMKGSIIGWAASHCNVGSLRVPGIKVCVALTPEDLGTENSWCNVTDVKGIYCINDLPTGVPLYAMATAPGYELRPISYQVNTGHVIICNDFSTTPKIPALVAENTTQVNWFLVKSPFFLPFF